MNQQFSNKDFPGNHPVRVLRYNITDHFETVCNNSLKKIYEYIEGKKVKPRIFVDIVKRPLKTPFVNCGESDIYLDENYLAFLWAITYSLYVIYDKGIQHQIAAGKYTGRIDYTSDTVKRARQLFIWALTLKEDFSEWDLSLPNPERCQNDEEFSYVGKANAIFVNIIVYKLVHEFSHLINDHCTSLSEIHRKKAWELTEIDIILCKQIETEADNLAFDSIVDALDSDTKLLHSGLAILLAHCSSLFMISDPEHIKQSRHPDIDNRILSAIHRLNLQDVASADYIWLLGSVCCKFFFDHHNIPTDGSPVSTAQDLFFRYLEKFDEIKSKP